MQALVKQQEIQPAVLNNLQQTVVLAVLNNLQHQKGRAMQAQVKQQVRKKPTRQRSWPRRIRGRSINRLDVTPRANLCGAPRRHRKPKEGKAPEHLVLQSTQP